MHRYGRGLLAAILALSLAAPVSAQGEVVTLTYRLRPGEVFYYQLARTIQQTIEIGIQRRTEESRIEAREALRVLDVDASGAMVVEWLFEDFKRISAAGATPAIDTPLMLKVRPDGTVLTVQRGGGSPEYLQVALPGRPVSVGDSWTLQLTRCECKTTYTYTLVRIDQTGGERIAVIRVQASGRTSVRSAWLVVRGSGEIHWSIDRGRIVRSTEEVTLDTTIEVSNAETSVRLRHVIKITERRDPVAGEAVRAVPPSAEWLIVPGSTIGAWTLQAPVSDYTGRYGTPNDRGVRPGFLARLLRWEPGPAALVDPADADRVLGLEVADKQYRTDKGIGFGSSEGAVLIAYGMSPARVDLTLPDLGAMRFLVYDDLGIAFALNLDSARAARGPSHAPVGAVDWTIVFAPGTAGKVLQLP